MLQRPLYPAVSFALLAFSLPSSGLTQERGDLVPLSEWAKLPESRKNTTYPLVRCAAPFTAIVEYGGANLPNQDIATADNTVRSLLSLSVAIRLNANPDLELQEISRQHDADRFEIADSYRSRFTENFATHGEAYGADPLVISDLEICGAIAENLP